MATSIKNDIGIQDTQNFHNSLTTFDVDGSMIKLACVDAILTNKTEDISDDAKKGARVLINEVMETLGNLPRA